MHKIVSLVGYVAPWDQMGKDGVGITAPRVFGRETWEENNSAVTGLLIGEGGTFVQRKPGESVRDMIVRAAHEHGTDAQFQLTYEDE